LKKSNRIGIYIAVLLILISPIYDYYFNSSIELWMFSGVIIFLFLFINIVVEFKNSIPLRLFFFFLFCVGFFEILKTGFESIFGVFLFILSLIILPALFSLRNELSSGKFIKLLNKLTLIICLYAFYQFTGNLMDLPFTGSEIYRGREKDNIKQVTSFFAEPAFLSLFLVASFYINSFLYNNIKYPILIGIAMLLSQSVSGVFSLIFLVILKIVSDLINAKKISTLLKASIVLSLIIGVIINLGISLFEDINTRISLEVLENLTFIGSNPLTTELSSSGAVRIISEINFIIYTLKTSPIFGFGIDYSEESLNRFMALNGFTEIIIRLGIIGLMAFYFLYKMLLKGIKANRITFMLFSVLYFTIDGAIAKPQFWFFYSLVVLGLHVNKKNNNEDIFNHESQST
jgi:hypothetical protein